MAAGSLRLAVAQPRTVVDPDAEVNVARAVELAARAADLGASLILFPEGYPGPVLGKPRDTYEAAEAMESVAADNHVSVCWSRMERCDDENYRLVVYAVDHEGRQLLRYERAHPATLPPDETRVWVAPGPDLALFEIDGVRMGIVVCSELWIPEPTRVLALRGAQVILSPAGGGFTSLTDNWQTIVRARAIENLCYVAMTNNIRRDEVGAAMIAGPEYVLVSSGTEELLLANLDLDRVEWLRAQDDSIVEPKAFSSIPGLLRARRPELYEDLVKPGPDLYDFHTPPETG
ncbi:MAG: carbon-nitrogen hydrolase family protein [Acidimicrobiia bacterium]|nr:carbon-nitrogen hydrolase family protein [Acidimicrobiia bacterium]